VVVLPVLALFGVFPSWTVIFFPFALGAQLMFLIGLALALSMLNVFFRDTAPTVEVAMQAWFFLTPVIYDPGRSVGHWHGIDVGALLQLANPMAAIITLYRQALLYHVPPDPTFLVRTLIVCAVVLFAGYSLFHRYSDSIGDEL
jgi:lipopolysaccharide transport system permease protein